MKVEIDLSNEEINSILVITDKNINFRKIENEIGRASYEQFDIEDLMGGFGWLLEKVASSIKLVNK